MNKLVPGLLGLCLLSAGCGLARNATRNVATEIAIHLEENRERCRFRRLARQELRTTGYRCSVAGYQEYGDGFEDGFVDFLMKGGTGEPPSVPPQRFWATRYESAEGVLKIQSWFDGYRQGAVAAMQSGYRQWVILPSAMSTAVHPPVFVATPAEAPPEILPYPRERPSGRLPPAPALPRPANAVNKPAAQAFPVASAFSPPIPVTDRRPELPVDSHLATEQAARPATAAAPTPESDITLPVLPVVEVIVPPPMPAPMPPVPATAPTVPKAPAAASPAACRTVPPSVRPTPAPATQTVNQSRAEHRPAKTPAQASSPGFFQQLPDTAENTAASFYLPDEPETSGRGIELMLPVNRPEQAAPSGGRP